MTEKKIDLSDVVVGQKLWTIGEGDCSCFCIDKNGEDYVLRAGLESYNASYTVDGKLFKSDIYPSCYHSRDEFLEFHGIAPVRMTRSVLNISFQNSERQYSSFVYYEMGYKLAGGQIIEEPKNLPCPKCGCEMVMGLVDWKLRHPTYNYCSLSGIVVDRDLWNDESKRGVK